MTSEPYSTRLSADSLQASVPTGAGGVSLSESLELLFELSSDIICVVGVDGHFQLVNPQFSALLGHTEAELLARPFLEFVHPDDVERTARCSSGVIEPEAKFEFENRYQHKDGGYIWLQWSTCCADDGQQYCVGREVTDERRLASLLKDTQRTARVGGWELDFRTEALYWTDETYRIHETSPEEFTPTLEAAVKFYAPESLPIISAAVEESRQTGKSWDLELRLVTAKGREIQVRTVGRVDSLHGQPIRAYGSFQDITERRELEERLIHSQKLEGIGRLAGGVAHDFNNLLTVILGNAEYLQTMTELPEEAQEAVDAVRQAAVQAAGVTGQLLTFARKQINDPQIIDLGDRVEELAPVLDRLLGEDIDLKRVVEECECTVLLDPGHFEQVLVNFAVNASDAMDGVGELRIEVQRTTLPAEEHGPGSGGEYVELIVRDTGGGIPADVLPHIFEPFFTTKRTGKGTGLGLSTCHGIVEQNGGQIRAENDAGRGTAFHVLLPFVPSETSESETPPDAEIPRGTETLLLVEDEPLVRQVAVNALSALGYQVLSAADGPAAIALAKSTSQPIQALVTDVVLPGMGGRTVARKLHELMGPLPTLYISG